MRSRKLFAIGFILASVAVSSSILGQSRTNSSGTGGLHVIQGRVYLPSGKSLDSPVRVELQSSTFPSLSVHTDQNGAFFFRGLHPGNYTVVVNAGDSFEVATESITIDGEVQLSKTFSRSTTKVFTVPLYLQAKRGVALRNDIINAKWASIPKEAIDRVRRGIELNQEGKRAEAEVQFQKAIELAPSFAPAHTELGKMILQDGKPEKALEPLRTAIRYDEKDFDAHLNLGMAYLNLKKYEEAEPELVAAAYLDPGAVTPHYYLGIVFVMKNDQAVAQKAFERAK